MPGSRMSGARSSARPVRRKWHEFTSRCCNRPVGYGYRFEPRDLCVYARLHEDATLLYLRQDVVLESLRHLDQVHPFFGLGFLVCKHNKLPIGRMTSFSFGHEEEQFLREYYHPNLA